MQKYINSEYAHIHHIHHEYLLYLNRLLAPTNKIAYTSSVYLRLPLFPHTRRQMGTLLDLHESITHTCTYTWHICILQQRLHL